MNLLKSATDWAKAELISTPFFVLASLLFLAAGIGFWQLGKTDLARAYIIPTLVAGTLLVIIGTGLFYTNRTRLAEFPWPTSGTQSLSWPPNGYAPRLR